MAQVRFVIISQLRTGSMLVKEMLNAHSQALCLNELFHGTQRHRLAWHRRIFKDDNCFLPPHEQNASSNPVDYLEHTLWPLGANARAIGFKLTYSQAQKWGFWDLLRHNAGVHIIHIIRNPIAAFISLLEARASNVWHSYTAKPRQVYALPRRHPEPLEVMKFVEKTMDGQAKVAGLPNRKILISYLDLLQQLDITMSKVYRFLNLPYEQISPTMKKTRPFSIEERIDNLEQVRAELPEKYRYLVDRKEWLV